jgi:hypothetical protein
MSKHLLSLAAILAAGALTAGTPPTIPGAGSSYSLVADDHGGGSGGGSGRDGSSGRSSDSGRNGSDDGPNHDLGDDHGVDSDDGADDHGLDVNDLPDDSDVLLIPVVHT